jgi:PAS domain S-box-containing protein
VWEIERLNRLYSALNHVNQAIVGKRTRSDLLGSVCQVLVDHGGFGMAWIGWHDRDTERLVPVAQAGDQSGELQRIAEHAGQSGPGRAPWDYAFRESRPYICNDVFADPATLPWRAGLERQGLRSCAAFPIHANASVLATLSVYANCRGFFREKEIALLAEACADISSALENLADRDARQRTEEIVKQYASIVESTDDAILSKTLEGTLTSWNLAAESMFGYSAAEVVGRSIEMLIPPDRPGEERMILQRISSGERIKQLETIRMRKDGTLFPVSITVSPIWGTSEGDADSPKVVGVSKIVRDITERKRAEAVAESEQRFATGLIEAMPGIFYLYDEAGRFLRWNRNFEKVSGYSSAEIGRMHLLDFFCAQEKPLLQQRIALAFEEGEATVEASFVSKDGVATPYFFTAKRIVWDGTSHLVGVGVDISKLKRAELLVRGNEERYRRTLDTILEGCQLLDFDWRYVYLNPAAAIQNRRANTELLGRTMLEVWPDIEATELFALLRRCMQQRLRVHAETEFAFADGSTSWFDVRAQPVKEGIFVLSIDITERKQAEDALRELNESLERKVATRTVDLEAARERAEAADRIKSAFLATMSHELRTPLNSILGFTGIILKGMAGPLNPEQSKQLGMVQGSARHLLGLINDVLDISKIEAGQLEVRCELFDLRASIDRVIASILPQAQKKGLTLSATTPEDLGQMWSDQRRVEQILLNLLNNGIKFTQHGGVTLVVDVLDECAADRTGQTVRLQVSDTGIGMEARHLPLLFQPFRQIDSGLQRQHEGTGLGLAICLRLTGLLGGTIDVDSVCGRGSVFTLLLPMEGQAHR